MSDLVDDPAPAPAPAIPARAPGPADLPARPTLVAADTIAPAALHALFVAAFADYLAGPFQLALAEWPGMLARHGVDLARSRVAVEAVDGRPLALAFAAPRRHGRRWRLATMCALPEARGSGVAAALLDDFVARASAAGQAAVELECFAQNERALRLYKRRGFKARHELVGYTLAEGAAIAPPVGRPPREVGRELAFDWLDAAERRIGDLPLQVTGASLAGSPRPLRFWQRGAAQLVWSDTGEGPIQVHSLVDGGIDHPDAERLVTAMRATRPGAAVSVPAVQRDDLCGGALRRLGFERQALHQVLMVRVLALPT